MDNETFAALTNLRAHFQDKEDYNITEWFVESKLSAT